MTHRAKSSAARKGLVLAALLAAACLVSSSSAAADRPVPGPRPAPAVRSAATLPSLAEATRGALPANAIVSQSDTFLVSSHGFDRLEGGCDTRGWAGQDRSSLVFAHVSDRWAVNQAYFSGVYGDPAELPGSSLTPMAPEALALLPGGEVAIVHHASEFQILAVASATHQLRGYADPEFTMPQASSAVRSAVFGLLVAFSGMGQLEVWNPTRMPVAMGDVLTDTTRAAAYFCPMSLAADAAGNVYFADCDGRVRMWRTDDRIVTLAGVQPLSAVTDTADGLPATQVRLSVPEGVAVDAAGTTLYILESGRHRIRVVDLATGIIGTVFGDGTPETLPDHHEMAYDDATGALFVALTSGRIGRIADGALTVVAGGAGFYGASAGVSSPTQQLFRSIQEIVADGMGGVYFLGGLSLVFHLDAAGTLTTIAGEPLAVEMGSRALWFGADRASHPDEVANWVDESGYGGGWSQRLVSPGIGAVPANDPRLTFDGVLHLTSDGTIAAAMMQGNEFLVVQGFTGGMWVDLPCDLTLTGGLVGGLQATHLGGYGRFKAEARLSQLAGYGTVDSIRFLVQTVRAGNAEDGFGPDAPDGALVLDNVRLVENGADLLPPLDFEDGTLGGWRLTAANGIFVPSGWGPVNILWAADPTDVALRSGHDFTDPGCAWTFLAPGQTVNHSHVTTRLTSPWFAVAPGDTGMLVTFSGKLANLNSGRLVSCWMRTKSAGDTHARTAAQSNFAYNSGAYGEDVSSPFLEQRVLRYPQDFQLIRMPGAVDSVQVVYEVWSDYENLETFAFPEGVQIQPVTGLPFLDDLRVYQLHVDRDHDGVADASDPCPDVCAAGQDEDADGCLQPTATLRHVESWDQGDLPLRVVVSANGDPHIANGSDLAAIEQGLRAWTGTPGSAFQITLDPPTAQTDASSMDGVNLVTFEDDYAFPPNVIGVTPTLSALRRTAYGDRIVLPGQIVDADLILNPQIPFRTAAYDPGPGSIDLQSVITHEAGHMFGLSHSGVLGATMFFVLQAGDGAASLADDDLAAIAAAYPDGGFEAATATIRGTVTRGGSDAPVPGALVTAVRLDASGEPADSVASDYTDEQGGYALRGLAAGDYGVRVTPLDGEVGGYGLTPDYISERVQAIAESNFTAEWWSASDSDRDPPDVVGSLALTAGEVRVAIDVVTNVDTVAPAVVSVTPADGATGLAIDTPLLVNFSERIDGSTIGGNVRLHPTGESGTIGMSGRLINNGRSLVLTPDATLEFGTSYLLEVLTGLRDREGVPLATAFGAGFTTEPAPPVTITSVTPQPAYWGQYVTIRGTGFRTGPEDTCVAWIAVVPAGSQGVLAASVTPTTMVVRVPVNATGGDFTVTVNGTPSNTLATVSFLPPPPVTAPSPTGEVTLAFPPSDVAVAPDGRYAFVVGSGGIAAVMTGSSSVEVGQIGDARSIAIAPDGLSGVVTRPEAAEVLRVGTNPSNPGTFLQVIGRAPLPPGARPVHLALSPDGASAFVTDPSARLVYRVDLRAGATQDSVIAEYADSTAVPGGIAMLPDGGSLVYGSNLGTRRIDLPSGALAPTEPATPSGAGVAATAGELLFAGTGLLGDRVEWFRWTEGLPTVQTGSLAMGGEPRDVVFGPDGRAAYVVNGGYNLLQMLDTDPASPRYHARLAEVATGQLPVAVAVSAAGNVIAVANQGSRSLSFYLTGGTAGLVRAVPPVARPGDVVALQGSGGALAPGSEVDAGTGLFAPARALGDEGAFVVPEAGQRDLQVAAVDPSGSRTLGIPFRVVDPIATPTPRLTGFGVRLDSMLIVGGTEEFPPSTIRYLDLSPDGRMVAVLRDLAGNAGFLELLAADGEGLTRLGAVRLQVNLLAGGDQFLGTSFTSDGRYLWFNATSLGTIVLDADPSSLQFGMGVATLPGGDLGPIAADPLGRYMIQGDQFADTLRFFTDVGAARGMLDMPGPSRALAVSPDGHWLVAAGPTHVSVVDLDSLTLHRSVTHTGTSTDVGIAIPFDGRRAVVRHPYLMPGYGTFQRFGIYNLDPGAGTVGTELYLGFLGGATPGGPTVVDMVPAPDGHRVLMSLAGVDSLALFDPSALPPTVTWLPTRAAGLMALSADGSRLWTEANAGTTLDSLRLVSLGPASRLALVAGANQSGLRGQWLAAPLRLRATDANGRPQAGAVLRFDGVGGLLPILDQWDCPLWHVTDVNGEVEVRWRLSSTVGTDSLVVTLLGAGTQVLATAQVRVSDEELPPAVVSLAPQQDATGLSASTAVSVTFNKAMDPASVATGLVLYHGANPLPGAFSSVQDRTFLFQPAQPLAFGARCSLVVQAGVLDTYGLATAQGATAAFTVQDPPALRITSLSPPAGKVGIPVVVAGEGFSPVQGQNTVLFNGTLATVSNLEAASLTAVVPLAATSGPVEVRSSGVSSNTLSFFVLEDNAGPGGVINTVAGGDGVRDVAITQDGARAYVTSPTSNSVAALDVPGAATITNVTVGLQPVAIVLLPDDSRAYVANRGSNDVSVIDTRPAEPTVHTVVATIPVANAPVDVAVSPVGPEVIVVSATADGVSIIDANPANATFDQVTAVVNVGSGGGSAVVVSPDGARAFVATLHDSVYVIDLATDAVTAVVNVGSGGGQAVTVSPDGTTLFVLCPDGTIKVVNLSPGDQQYQVTAVVNVGSGGGQAVTVSPDGALLYVTTDDGTVIVYSIASATPPDGSIIAPGPSVTLTQVAVIPVGQSPAGIAIDAHGTFALVCNAGDGTVSVIGFPTSLPPVEAAFDFNPNTLNLRSNGRWVTGYIELPAPRDPADIEVATVRLNGIVPVDPEAPTELVDHDGDGIMERAVKFLRLDVSLALAEGDAVPVTVTGSLGTRTFEGTDHIRVKRARVTAPAAGQRLTPGRAFTVRWEVPEDLAPQWVAVLHTVDRGATWEVDATQLANSGSYTWTAPMVVADSVRVAVVLVEESAGDSVTGCLGVSPLFALGGATDVEPAPTALSFERARPNPAIGTVLMRFGLPRAAEASLQVYDVLGRRVRTLVSGARPAGWHEVRWDGRAEGGSRVHPGLYFVRFRAEGRDFEQRLVWLR